MKPIKIEILEQSPSYLRIRVFDDPHTYLNLLREYLVNRDEVSLVGYARERTFEDVAVFEIRTNGTADPIALIEEATQEIEKMVDNFVNVLEKALSE